MQTSADPKFVAYKYRFGNIVNYWKINIIRNRMIFLLLKTMINICYFKSSKNERNVIYK